MKYQPQIITPPALERYELKFVIPAYLVQPISDFVSVYCSLDKHSIKTDDRFYLVNNLYFDSPNYLFLLKRLDGSENRFNLRIRSYGDSTKTPYFLEIKQKKINIVRKYRASIYDENWYEILDKPEMKLYEGKNARETANKKLFLKMLYTYNALPKVLTQYKRKAYVSDIDDYGRVTFDTDLRYQPESGYNLLVDEDKMVPQDNSNLFDPECNVVLELKCHSTQVPCWMLDLIKYFNLRRRSFSKYVTGVSEVINLFKYDLSFRQTILNLDF